MHVQGVEHKYSVQCAAVEGNVRKSDAAEKCSFVPFVQEIQEEHRVKVRVSRVNVSYFTVISLN